MVRIFIVLSALAMVLAAVLLGPNRNPGPTAGDFLPVEQAFVLDSEHHGDELRIRIHVAPGHYLYRHSITAAGQEVSLGEWHLPEGEPYQDEYFGQSQVYRERLELQLPLHAAGPGAQVELRYQGCTTGLCYPPQTVLLPIAYSSR